MGRTDWLAVADEYAKELTKPPYITDTKVNAAIIVTACIAMHNAEKEAGKLAEISRVRDDIEYLKEQIAKSNDVITRTVPLEPMSKEQLYRIAEDNQYRKPQPFDCEEAFECAFGGPQDEGPTKRLRDYVRSLGYEVKE